MNNGEDNMERVDGGEREGQHVAAAIATVAKMRNTMSWRERDWYEPSGK